MDCALRRLDQELGIRGLDPDFRHQVSYRAEVGNGLIENEVVDVFVASAPRDLNLQLNPAEVMETRWVTLDELDHDIAASPENFTPWLRIYLKDHRRAIFG